MSPRPGGLAQYSPGKLDARPTILILTPIRLPVVKQAGIDPIHFGVLFIIVNAIGLITPPVGTVLNVVCGVSKLSMDELMKGVWPFLLAQLAVLVLLILSPALASSKCHVGNIFVLCCEIGFLTPPLGVNLFVAMRLAGVSLESLSKSALPYVAVLIVSVVLIVLFPQLALWLPNLFYAR